MNKVAVLINFYKEDISENEIKSLRQCIKVLKDFDLFLLGPNDINLKNYLKHVPGITQFLVPGNQFKGVKNYNKFLLSESFYSSFLDYDRILIYQLDCFVFKDELNYWSEKDWDYIGSPFFEGFEKNTNKVLLGVGNGGFSLRNPRNILHVLKNWENLISFKRIFSSKYLGGRRFKLKLFFYKFLSLLTGYYLHKPLNLILNNHQDDVCIGLFLSKESKLLKTPSPEEASKFSTEIHSSFLFELNNQQLPFGCHAWEKYEKSFWEKHILKHEI